MFTKTVWLLYDKWTIGESGRKLGRCLVAVVGVKEQDDGGVTKVLWGNC